MQAPSRQARAHLAGLTSRSNRYPDDPELARQVAAARRRFRFERAAEYITELVESAPALTQEQRARLATLLAPSTAA